MKSGDNKKFDLIIFGATGFTGKLVCEYIKKKYSKSNLNWGIAGRNKQKLALLKEKLTMEDKHVFFANSNDYKSLYHLASNAKVICSTVGPYAIFGDNLMKACIKAKTHYCDITGEVQWIRKMIDKFHLEAKDNNVKIINSCGFDSIPSDMGVYYLQKRFHKEFSRYSQRVSMRVLSSKGGISGGTYYSFKNILSEVSANKSLIKILNNPYGLNPVGKQNGPDNKDLTFVTFDEISKRWIAPFVMAGINTKIVRRSNALLQFKYGKNFSYNEAIITGKGLLGKVKGYLSLVPIFIITKMNNHLLKSLIDFFMPKPGEGPSKRLRENGYYKLIFYSKINNYVFIVKVTGDMDPGYGSTSKMLAESAICLAIDKTPKFYGFVTPSVGLGDALLNRLTNNAGLNFSVKKKY